MDEPVSGLPVATHVDEVHLHPKHTGHRWFDITLALAAIFISLVSLYVAIEHGRTERDLVSANSWPFLQPFETTNLTGRDDVALGVANAGTGPAKIYSVQIALDGKPVSSPAELLERCCGAPAEKAAWHQAFPEGSLRMGAADLSVLRPGEQTEILVARRNRHNDQIVTRFGAALPRLSFDACFCSVLDECWTSGLRALRADRVQSCRRPAHPYRFSEEP